MEGNTNCHASSRGYANANLDTRHNWGRIIGHMWGSFIVRQQAEEMCRYRFLFATISAICSLTSGFADDAKNSRVTDVHWYACEASDDCAWVIGEGGWPVAVRASSALAFREWVRSQAPFTTYFTPGDCFGRDEEFELYALESKSRVACVDRRCALEVEPKCTK